MGKKNKQEKNQRELRHSGKIVGSYSLNRESGFAWINIKNGINIEDAANAAHLFAMQHNITVKVNIDGLQINVPTQKGTTPKQIVRRYYKACHGNTR